MTYDELIEGLKLRGFEGTDEICNKGGCHKNECHYILLTDGLVIYSNTWDWNDKSPTTLARIRCLDNPEDSWLRPDTKQFEFWMLDNWMGKS